MIPPKISVLTSCYNASEFLSEAVESILSQTYRDFEFILIDDGSTDETLDIIKGYAAKDRRIVVIQKQNTGLTDSLNVGLKVAKGDWIARMDADDIALPTRLQSQMNFIACHPRLVLLGGGCITIDDRGKDIRKYEYPHTHDKLVRHLEKGRSPFPHSTALYNRRFVFTRGGYRNRLNGAEDNDLWLRMCQYGEIACLRTPLVKLRKHGGSITSKRSERLVILSYAGTVSHFIRKMNLPDPIDQSEETFSVFIDFVRERLIMEAVFDNAQAFSGLRQIGLFKKNINNGNGVTYQFSVLKNLVATRKGLKFLRERIFGTRLPHSLALEWVEKGDSRH